MIKTEKISKYILPPGPILSFTLIGLLLLSAVVYYRAVKIQRFLEPALAISQPRMQFTQEMNNLIMKDFGPREPAGVIFRSGSVFVEQRLLFSGAPQMAGLESLTLKKLASVFLAALEDPRTRDHISLILVSTRLPLSRDAELNKVRRANLQERADGILTSLFGAEPELEKRYGRYFAATVLPVGSEGEAGFIEFRIVPTERLHIEVLKRLGKYVF